MHSAVSVRHPTSQVAPGRLLQALLRVPRAPRLSVLIFHRVLREADPLRRDEPAAAEFESRMRWVAANFDVLTLSQAIEALAADRVPKRALVITFDDGYADNHDLALPILRRAGLPATFFVASGYLDGGCMFNDVIIETVRQVQTPTLELDSIGLGRHATASLEDRKRAIGAILGRVKYLEPARRHALARQVAQCAGAAIPTDLMMTSQQVAALHAAGMEIGAHTVSHPILAETPIEAARDEIIRNRERLQEIIGAPVRVFAYPNGKPVRDYRNEHAALVRELGFIGAVSTAWGAARAGCDIFQIPRFTPWDRTDLRFGLRLIANLWRRDYEMA